MLALKLSRTGKKKNALYSLIVTEKSNDPWGKYLEKLGTYNPHTKVGQFVADRIKYWIEKGAQMTPTVNNLLIEQKVIEGQKTRASKSQPGKKKQAEIASAQKNQESAQAAAKKDQDAADAAAKAEAEKPADETPVAPVPEPAPEVVPENTESVQ
ncbi:MAG: 30S ribosomal protein S16 [Patescibacteria group bacterium]